MANRNRLIESWQKRLKLGLQLTHDASPRLQAIGKVYVRVYRFLLSTYSGTFWGSVPEPPSPDSDAVSQTSGESIIPRAKNFKGCPPSPSNGYAERWIAFTQRTKSRGRTICPPRPDPTMIRATLIGSRWPRKVGEFRWHDALSYFAKNKSPRGPRLVADNEWWKSLIATAHAQAFAC